MTVSRVIPGIIAAFLAVLATSPLQAQFIGGMEAAPPPSVLTPDPSQWWIGPQIGVNINSHSGDFVTEFCNCTFADGSGAGLSAGFEIGRMFSPLFGIALKLVYNDLRADYSYNIVLDAVLEPSGETVQANYERSNAVKLGYFMLHPVLQVHPFTGFYLFAGPAFGFNTTAERTYTLKIADERYLFEFGDPETKVVEEDSGEIPEAEGTRMDLRAGIGVNIRLGRSFLFSPEVSYGLPLTTISADDNWKAEAIHLVGVFKFEL
jgi:hypothetical protein